MGLDMFLEGEKFLWKNHRKPELNPIEDGFAVKGRTLRLGYWRKHPDLHGYIVNTFADGKDECQDIELGPDELRQILAASEADKLPETSGFFFGKSQPEDKAATKEILEKAIAWLEEKEPNVSRSVTYRASW
jgi:hypothetical protein